MSLIFNLLIESILVKKKFPSLIFILTLLIPSLALANIEVKVDRSQLSMGETVELVLSTTQASAEIVNAKPQLEQLEKDFSIIGSSKRSQLSIINGETSRLTEWVITLMPLHSGDITIPSLQLGTEHSATLKIQVLSATQSTTQKKQAPVFLEVSIDNRTPYVQQQVNYTVRLYYSERLTDGEMTDPQAKNALVLRVGNDKSSQTKKNDKLYQVLERRYIVFPQSSGEIKIVSPEFNGAIETRQISAASNQYNPFFMGISKPLRVVAPSEILQVKEIPPKVSPESWLPAKKITLTESWSVPLSQWRVGQPVTRTILLEAEGLSSTQLRAIPLVHPAGLNHYADKEETDTTLQGDVVIGRRIEKIVYIPLQTGDIEFAAVTIPWWNTDLNRLQQAGLGSKTAHVLAAAGKNNQELNNKNSDPTPVTPFSSATVNTPLKDNNQPVITPAVPVNHSATWLPWVIAAFFALLWLVTVFLFCYLLWRGRHSVQLSAQNNEQKKWAFEQQQTKKHWQQKLKQACLSGNYLQAKESLLAWAKINWPDSLINSLSDVSRLTKCEELNVEIDRLNAILYGVQAEVIWQGELLWQAFKDFNNSPEAKAQHNKIVKKNELPNLYLND